MDFAADNLIEPYRRIVPVTQIPRRMHWHFGLVVNPADTAGAGRLAHLCAVEGAEDRGLKAALILLVELVLAQLRPGGIQLGRRQQP